jgi:hypothetical protein
MFSPAGWMRQPVFNRKPPSPVGPTVWTRDLCEYIMVATTKTTKAPLRMIRRISLVLLRSTTHDSAAVLQTNHSPVSRVLTNL